MTVPILVMGHKHPDNDAISAAVGYAYLKNELEKKHLEAHPEDEPRLYIPVRLGSMPEESSAVMAKYGIEPPSYISHVHARVLDVMTRNLISITEDSTLLKAGRLLRKHNIRALVVVDEDGKYKGLITTRMIAERYISAVDLQKGNAQTDTLAVANDLIFSLTQPVSELVESEVLILEETDLLKEAVEDLMASELREAVVLDKEGYCIGIVTRSDVARRPRRKVILVDHNERSQAADGIEEADVIEIVDHHRIGDITTKTPIQFFNLPVGSSATIVTMRFRRNNIEIPKGIAAVLLSAIMTDTVILKSPTATDVDLEQAEYLADIVGTEFHEFGLEVFKSRSDDATMPVEEIVTNDSKEFLTDDGKVLICQHETVTLEALLAREEEIREYMRDLIRHNDYKFVLTLITDIYKEGSQMIVEGDDNQVDRAFGVKSDQSVWLPGVLSRKKQIVPRLLG